MKSSFSLLLTLFAFNMGPAVPAKTFPRADFYKDAQSENFNIDELELVRPLIDSLQAQYDRILSKAIEDETIRTVEHDIHLRDLIMSVLHHLTDEDDISDGPFKYYTNLPTINDLKGSLKEDMPSEEVHDLENILQENIDDAQETIQDLVDQSNETEAKLLSINIAKLSKFIYKILGNIFSTAVRVSRAAYCTYSYIPIINSTLNEGRTNIGSCYLYGRNSIRHLHSDVQSSIDHIRENIVELITIYKKISHRQSLLGKLFTLLLNVSKITNDINDSRSTAYNTIEEVKTEVPTITATTKECATYSIPSFIKQLNETITGLTTCINFVDDSTQGPEPEPESSEDSSEEVD